LKLAPEKNQHIPFLKMTGSGNDFIVIDNRTQRINADHCQDLVRSACRRKLSVGADGLILIENDDEVDFKWRFFNADGSEAEMCGNGGRCAVRFVHLRGIVQKQQMDFRTLAGIIHAEMRGDRVKLRMTSPQGMETHLCLEVDGKTFSLHFVNTGVPHAVTFLDDEAVLEKIEVFRYGRSLRFHPRFQPEGTNANFAYIRDDHFMRVRTYERGVEEETLACGTGCIAAALVAAGLKRVSSPVQVLTQGDEILIISFKQRGSLHFSDVHMEGDAKVVYSAELWNETLN
jgi:diaminopimelate epimerase